MKKVLLAWLVAAGLVASSAYAGVDASSTKTEDGVRVFGLNSTCPGFTTPESVPIGAGGLADLWATLTWRSVVSDSGLMVTTIRAKDTDDAGRRFKIKARFTVQGTFVPGLGWVFTSPIFLGQGSLEVTREDGAKVTAEASFAFDRGGGTWTIAGFNGACSPPKH
jgi:hypothetical protein